jgi:hypothetical protein
MKEIIIPHYVMRLDDDATNNSNNKGPCRLAKALFVVPEEFVVALAAYPVLCRGSSFVLTLDPEDALRKTMTKTTTAGKMKQQHSTAFLSTVFESPYPEDTAKEIAL